jgi:elongation factor G
MPGERETITKPAQARFAHKRVLKDGGEFALVSLSIEPLSRDSGIEIRFVASESIIPTTFWPGIESGVRNAARFGLNGRPIVDFRAVILDGAYHDIDSTAATFERAAAEAFRQALKEAGTVILF